MSYSLSINQHVPFLKQWGLKVFSSRNNFWIIFVNVKSSVCSKTKVKYKIIQDSKESCSYIVLESSSERRHELLYSDLVVGVDFDLFRFQRATKSRIFDNFVITLIWHLFRSNIYRDGFYYRLKFKIKRTQQVKERQYKWD